MSMLYSQSECPGRIDCGPDRKHIQIVWNGRHCWLQALGGNSFQISRIS